MDSERTPQILSKVIPVFVYNLMYIQLCCSDWAFYFPVGYQGIIQFSTLLAQNRFN